MSIWQTEMNPDWRKDVVEKKIQQAIVLKEKEEAYEKEKNRVEFERAMNALVGKTIDTMISRRSMKTYVLQLSFADLVKHFTFDETLIALQMRFLSLGYECKYEHGSLFISFR